MVRELSPESFYSTFCRAKEIIKTNNIKNSCKFILELTSVCLIDFELEQGDKIGWMLYLVLQDLYNPEEYRRQNLDAPSRFRNDF
jgi:hypothetical protein